MIYVERIRENQSPLYRRVRLEALADSPHAFAKSLAEEQALSLNDWSTRTRKWARDEESAGFFAIENGKVVGLIGVYLDDEDPTLAIMVSFWVHPLARGGDASRLLVETVMDWARAKQAVTLGSWVVEDNEPAKKFYRKNGFRLLDDRMAYALDPSKQEMLMVKPLQNRSFELHDIEDRFSEDVISLNDYMAAHFDRVSA